MIPRSPASAPRADQSAAKAAARATVRARRLATALSPELVAARRDRVLAAAAGHSVVATYVSAAGEPDTLDAIERLHRAGVRVLVPLLAGHRTPAWADYAGADALTPGFRGILEPTGPAAEPGAFASATFVLTSALAATPSGHRLGTGGGWWDRALADAHPDAVVATLVNDHEVVPEVPLEPWDRPVHLVITELRTLEIPRE